MVIAQFIAASSTAASTTAMTPRHIAILGWGSLLWDHRADFDEQHHSWKFDGPKLKIEFSRVSKSRHGALTLAIDQGNGTACRVAYAESRRADPEDVICDLRSREGTTRLNIGFYYADGSQQNCWDSDIAQLIVEWAKKKNFDVVIWTALKSNFNDICGKPFTLDAAVAYVQSLDEEGKAKAAEYVWRAPGFVDTPLRRELQRQPWFKSNNLKGG